MFRIDGLARTFAVSCFQDRFPFPGIIWRSQNPVAGSRNRLPLFGIRLAGPRNRFPLSGITWRFQDSFAASKNHSPRFRNPSARSRIQLPAPEIAFPFQESLAAFWNLYKTSFAIIGFQYSQIQRIRLARIPVRAPFIRQPACLF